MFLVDNNFTHHGSFPPPESVEIALTIGELTPPEPGSIHIQIVATF